MSRSDSEINKTLCNTRRVFKLCHFIWLKKWARKHQSGISEDFPFMPSLMTDSPGFITVIGSFCSELGFYKLSVSVWHRVIWALGSHFWHGSSQDFPSFWFLCMFSSVPKLRLPLLDLCQHSPVPLVPGSGAWCHLLCLFTKSHCCFKRKPHMVLWYSALICL